MSLATVTSMRSTLAERRALRQQRLQLARELASYTSSADRLELDMILGRHTEEQTAELDAILSEQATAASYRLSA